MGATQEEFRFGTAEEHAVMVGALKEVTYNTTDNILVAHDGVTPGGFPILPSQAAGFVSLQGEISKGTGDTLNIPQGMVNIGGNGKGYMLAAQVDFDPVLEANRDSSFTALAVGDDIYIYATQYASGTAKIVSSKNSTFPTGYTATNSRKIGGFHYGRARVVDVNGTPIDGAGAVYGADVTTPWEANVTNGAIVPNSCWDLQNRPTCDPTGMAKVGNFWVDIYLASANVAPVVTNGKLSAGTSQSAYGGTPLTGTELLNQYLFNELASRTGKRLLSLSEHHQISEGSPQGNGADNINAWSATTNPGRAITGTVVNAISANNFIDCVGNVWEWLDEFMQKPTGATPAYYDPMAGQGVGQLYMYEATGLAAVITGGNWSDGVFAGSRSVSLNSSPWSVNTSIGSRFACDAL